MFWYLILILGAVSATALLLSIMAIARLRHRAVGRRLLLALFFLLLSALTELMAAAYWALRGYGAGVAIPALAMAIFLTLSALSIYRFVSV